jgi:hypothetical protein
VLDEGLDFLANSFTDLNEPRRIALSAIIAKNRCTWLSHEQ